MANVISIANQKGGVGKTTSAFNLAWALHEKGNKVLLIDNDPQGNLTSYAAYQGVVQFTIDEVYLNRRNLVIEPSMLLPLGENISLLPADNMLAGVEYYLVSRTDKEKVLQSAMVHLKELFDFIIIDNPPALGLLTLNGLMASNWVLVPVLLEYFSMEGVALLNNTLEKLREQNHLINILGILPNLFDDRRRLNFEVLTLLEKQFGDKVLKSKIHNSVKLAESSGRGESIFKYSPNCRASLEFSDLAMEILKNVETQANS